MSAIPPKVQSFFEKGFLPGGGGLDVAKSYDSGSSGHVCLNCISKIEGIATSLFHPAKGGLTVMLEERIGGRGPLDAALVRNAAQIKEKEQEMSASLHSFMTSMVTPAARLAVLKTDSEFIGDIARKIHMTALFILNIEPLADESVSLDGCKEVVRETIPPERIQYVLMSEKIEKGDDPRVIRLPSTKGNINFSYKDEQKNPQTIKDLGPIDIPDYQKFLRELAETKSLSESPIYTHMTRLWDKTTVASTTESMLKEEAKSSTPVTATQDT